MDNENKLLLRDILMRQTEYSEEEAVNKLEEYQYNIKNILNEYYNIIEKPKKTSKSVNQQTYTEIRNMMDTASANYRLTKELNERKEKIQKSAQLIFNSSMREREVREDTKIPTG
tara:strand:+ start:102 stop:446 length:345 start_codon:yes stop_codon:yes gene_type:complete